MKIIVCLVVICFAVSCKREVYEMPLVDNSAKFVTYTIGKGQNYPNNDSTTIIITDYTEQKFIAKFDSSAIYTTALPSSQSDINKLYGFADNNMFHQIFSARFGWNWLSDGLHLWAYDYNNGVRDFKDLGTIAIGKEINCSIKVLPNNYVFSVDGKETLMLRTSPTPTGVGYKLFPYFGGHETAPHEVVILVKEL